MEQVYQKLLRYAAVDTISDPNSQSCPSTEKQFDLAHLLKEEMETLGLTEIHLDENGYLFATLEANTEVNCPTIGFLAHMDTSPDYPGKCTNPQIIDYQGGDIRLDENHVIQEEKFPILKELVGEKIITTDGKTLLGADDKAGIAAIMSAMEHLLAHPEIKHGKIRIGFTPDEEIGRGPHKFDVSAFQADAAFTIDGGAKGELAYESFNACDAVITIHGESIHPGSAKGRLKNASRIGMELESMLPVQQKPEYTEGYEGFYLLTDFNGRVEEAKLQYIIRDFDKKEFENKKQLLTEIVDFLKKKYQTSIDLEITDSYYNMGEVMKDHMDILQIAEKAFDQAGVIPMKDPIRGGTDGSQLSFMGLPTPNIFTGGLFPHGPYEIAVISWMDLARDIVVNIAKNTTEIQK